MALIYEYMANGNLKENLSGSKKFTLLELGKKDFKYKLMLLRILEVFKNSDTQNADSTLIHVDVSGEKSAIMGTMGYLDPE
ncbi:LRR kinase family protein [Medicago truncatula]|uniref:LRR kinase family protein n=1 Tax=Medicago truncatula TaxID=3880 RepID=A0A072U9L1_MEDTR|nr:LRR kinase family protein [Medicago truncatula]